MSRTRRLFVLLCGLGLGMSLASTGDAAASTAATTPLNHVVVVMQQNHSFDNYFGTYPGADGIPNNVCMPVAEAQPPGSDCIKPYVIENHRIDDLNHSEAMFRLQYNQGRMDGFVSGLYERNQDGAIAMGHYDDRAVPYYWNLADEYVLFDRYFSSARAGSVWNRMFWVAGVAGSERNEIPTGGYGDIPTIFDRLQERGLSWKFYVRNYDPDVNVFATPDPLSPQLQWTPLLNFERFVADRDLASRIVDLDEYYADLKAGTLPAVSYVLLLGATEHPLTSLDAGQRAVKTMIQALMQSDAWNSSAFVVTYDDWGGWYDHVPPPQVDEYGYGFRVPTMLVSAYAKRGYIDSTQLDHTSLLKFIEDNWRLKPLATRDARANSIAGAFDFQQPPRPPHFISMERSSRVERAEPRRWVIYTAYGSGLAFAALVIGWALLSSSFAGPATAFDTQSRTRSERL